jgi:dipeptidase
MQNFEDVIKEDCYYVDKTPFIELVEESNMYFFYIRPRRFGKTLTLSMLENYYDINKKDKFDEIFGKLYIGQNPTPEHSTYLIIHLNFAEVAAGLDDYKDGLDNHCRLVFNFFCDIYAHILPADTKEGLQQEPDAVSKLRFLCQKCQEVGKKIYLFIDEYDYFTNMILAHEEHLVGYRNQTHGEGYLRQFFNTRKGIVWVARRIPDGYVSAHANQSRITTFPLDDPENCLYAPDVISFAREKGYFNGPDEEFSFCDAYAPADFGTVRGCDARVWAFFRTVADDMDQYTDYAMGYNMSNRMPLWVKPRTKVDPKTVFDAMRDHYEGTPMDMTQDIGAGGHALPYRWRPMDFEVDGVTYLNERAVATQQTGFWFVAQARPWLPDDMGILWFGVDDAATSCLTPIYCSATEVPECFREGNGTMLKYSPTSAFWLFNRVTNFAYLRYDLIAADIRKVVDEWENTRLEEVKQIDAATEGDSPKKRQKRLTRYSVDMARQLFDRWTELDRYLLVKYIDGNLKSETEPGKFLDNNLEMKVRNDKDTTGKEEYKKIKLLESFRLQSSYNFFADSMRWSVIQLSARTKVFNEKVNINLTGTLDPYAINANAVRINRYNGGIGRLTRVSASSGIQFSSDNGKNKEEKNDRLNSH